jgi:hypothetical protein
MGPVCDKGIWCIRTKGLNNLHQNIDIETGIKLRRFEWLGRLIRMENNKIPKIVLDTKLEGKRKVERPKL